MKKKRFLKETFKNASIILNILFHFPVKSISPKNKLARSYIDIKGNKE